MEEIIIHPKMKQQNKKQTHHQRKHSSGESGGYGCTRLPPAVSREVTAQK